MGSISIVHGIIKVEDLNNYTKVVGAMEADKNYPWIRPEMLNLCGEEHPYYYQNPIATFGATYKNLDGGVSWSEFILKFEHLLTQLQFDFARIRLETEFMGDYEFFWGSKRALDDKFFDREDLIECPKWFFGYGVRHMFGELEEKEPELPYDFQYPLAFDPSVKAAFNALIPELNQLEVTKRTFFDNSPKHQVFENHQVHLILTYLSIHKVIRFGWEAGNGLFIERLKEIKELKTPYSLA